MIRKDSVIMVELKHIVDRVKLVQAEEEEKEETYGINTEFFLDENSPTYYADQIEHESEIPKRRGRPPKRIKEVDINEPPPAPVNTNPATNPNMSYDSSYMVTSGLLATSIDQIDYVNSKILQDLETVRALRDKKKWEYIGGLAGTSTSLIGNKISAIREMNSIISKCHDLELRRVKELNLGKEEVDDDKRIMELYSAFTNLPVGSVSGMGALPFASMTGAEMMTANNGVPINANAQAVTPDAGYEAFLKNCTPEQNAMFMEQNAYIETVVVFDQSTQQKYFEVVDTRTGEVIPNMPLPSEFELDGVTVDVSRGTARNSQLRKDYKLKLVGVRGYNEY